MTNYAVLGAAFAAAHVVGTRRQGTEGAEKAGIVEGVSAQRDVLGQSVYGTEGKVVGKIDDLILTRKAISYAIVGVGGFLGLGRHDVAIPVNKFVRAEGRLVLPDATKEAIQAMPRFEYAMMEEPA
jgi:sporulation protein YlmC with PRC-barrel domain